MHRNIMTGIVSMHTCFSMNKQVTLVSSVTVVQQEPFMLFYQRAGGVGQHHVRRFIADSAIISQYVFNGDLFWSILAK